MKTILKIFLGTALLGGVAYTAFRFSPLGKRTLSKWLLDRWEKAAGKNRFDRAYLTAELEKLDYPDLELLARYTWFDPLARERKGKMSASDLRRMDRLLSQIVARRILQRADLSSLDNIIFPG